MLTMPIYSGTSDSGPSEIGTLYNKPCSGSAKKYTNKGSWENVRQGASLMTFFIETQLLESEE